MTQKVEHTATAEQVLYANILGKGMYFGLALLFITFAIYLFGIAAPVVPLERISEFWSLPVATHAATAKHAAVTGYLDTINKEFLHQEKAPIGWSWLYLIGKGDFMNFIPVALLSGVTIFCYAAIVPGLFARKDTAYAVMAIIEVLILSLAASGLLVVSGH